MAGTSPRVSFIITTRNRGRFLAEVLRNARDFITAQDELIIVDGASTDDTAAVVAANQGIVTRFISETDQSEGHAFNKALFCCQGELIKPLADDDYVYPEALNRAIDLMLKRTEIDVLQCGGEIWDGSAPGSKFRTYRRMDPRQAANPAVLFWAVHHFLGMIFRRRAAILVGGVNPRCRSIDGDMLLKFQENGCNIKYYDINLYKWYVHPHSGMLRTDEVERDYLDFNQRLLGHRVLFQLPPDRAIASYRLSGSRHAREFVQIVRCAYLYLQSGSGWMLRPLAFFLRAGLHLRARIARRRGRQSPAPAAPPALPESTESHPWTGELG